MTAVWAINLPSSHKIVLLALADNANDEGECFPSVSTLIKKCGLCERSIQRLITELESSGHVRRKIRSGRSTLYHITPATDAPPQYVHPAIRAPSPATDAPPPPQSTTLTPAIRAPITSKKPSREPSPNRQYSEQLAQALAFPGLDQEAFQIWIEHRKEIRKPIKPGALVTNAEALAALGEQQMAEVKRAKAGGWQGLHPDKRNGQQKVTWRPPASDFDENGEAIPERY